MPVSATDPVFWSVKRVDGSNEQRAIPIVPTPGQLRTWDTVHVAGVTLALITEGAPVPLRDTGEPATTKLPVMLAVPLAGPSAVGVNTTLMEQFPPAPSVVPQVPPDWENGAVKVKATAIPVRVTLPVLRSVSCNGALGVPGATLPKFSGPPVTEIVGGLTVKTTGALVPALVVTATFAAPNTAPVVMVNVAVTCVELTTATALTAIPVLLVATVAPVTEKAHCSREL